MFINWTLIFIFIFLFLILSLGFLVIGSKNPIHSILFLVLVFTATTGLLILFEVEFIAMLFLVVYVGAISVLFLFVVMMLNIKIVQLSEKFLRYVPISFLIAIIFLSQVLYILMYNFFPISTVYETITFNWFTNLSNLEIFNYYEYLVFSSNIESIGELLYTKYYSLFLVAGMILLVAMIGAIVLTLNQELLNKRQNIFIQNMRNYNTALKLFKLK